MKIIMTNKGKENESHKIINNGRYLLDEQNETNIHIYSLMIVNQALAFNLVD